jgi:DNA-binding IclR family transcriptional regulator
MSAVDAHEGPPEGVQRVQVLDRAVTLLRTIAEQPQPLNAFELAKLCNLNRTTAWRILVTLEQNGLVERDAMTQRYRIGFALGRLAAAADQGTLIRLARPLLQRLASGVREQVSLGVPHRFGWTYVDHVQPADGPPVQRWIGLSGPLHATASGKLFLAMLPPAEREAVLPPKLERFTELTPRSLAQLEPELDEILRVGFATSYGEHSELSSAACAGVLDGAGRPMAIVDVWGPSQRLTLERLQELGPKLRATADELAARLREAVQG